MELRGLEYLDRRILAAIRFVDVLGRPVTEPVAIHTAAGVRHFRKGPGLVIVSAAPGLSEHEGSFAAPPAAPAVGSVTVALDLRPAAVRLAPRRAVLALPRDPAQDAAGSVFAAAEITLLPSVLARLDGLAAGLLAVLRRTADGHLVEGALVRLRAPGQPPALAVTNAVGEALLLVPALPLASPGPDTSVVADLAAELDAIVVPAQARFHDPADAEALAAARRAEAARETGLPDPDALLGQSALATDAQTVRIAPAETRTATIDWTPT